MTEVLYSAKIKPEHLARKAIVYLRQSSERQVRQNKKVNSSSMRWPNGCVLGDRLRPARRLRAGAQLGGTGRGRYRRQPGSIAALPHRQRLVSAARGVSDLWNAYR